MSDFKREDRYTVIKHNQLTGSQFGHLKDFLLGEGVPTVRSVVIESDWPEYEPVWSMIERRMSEHADHVGVIVAKKWLEGAPRAVSLINGSSLPDGAYLYLAPPASSELAEVTLKILKEAKDIPDGLYARAKHLANTEQSQLAALREENRLLNHDIASFLETSAKTCELLCIDTDDAKHAEGKPSDVLFNHATQLQQRLADAERRNAECMALLAETSKSILRHQAEQPMSNRLAGLLTKARAKVDRYLKAALNHNPEAASHD